MTLVELVIVIMVMSIMTAVAAPAFLESLLYHRVESAARRVKADLELARQTARLKSAPRSIEFTATGYSLSMGIAALDDPNAAYAVTLTGPPYELDQVVANFSSARTLTFDGYGTPTSGGTVLLASKGHQCTVTVDGITGEVSIASNHQGGAAAAAEAP